MVGGIEHVLGQRLARFGLADAGRTNNRKELDGWLAPAGADSDPLPI